MRSSIFTSFSPNLEWDDFLSAWGLVLRPWRWRNGNASSNLEKKFAQDFGAKEAVSFESGRTALATLLETSGLNKGDEVALQAYTCVAVPNSVLWAGLKPLYIDCERETLTMSVSDLERRITPQTKAIIIQYTFGQVGDLEKLLEVAKRHNLLVIEDCAHVIGGKYRNQFLGSWGDASFFSFGRDKAISGVFGGLALIKDEVWGKRVRQKQKGYQLPGKGWVLKQLLHPVVTFKAKLLYDFFGFGKLIFLVAKKLEIISKTVEQEERRGIRPPFISHRLPNALAELALRQYGKLDRFNEHRQKTAQAYYEVLEKNKSIALPQRSETVLYLRFPLFVRDPQKLLQAAKKEKIYLGDWYQDPIAPSGVDYEAIGYQRGSCPVAEEIAKRSVNLPTDIHVTDKRRERILRTLEECLKK